MLIGTVRGLRIHGLSRAYLRFVEARNLLATHLYAARQVK